MKKKNSKDKIEYMSLENRMMEKIQLEIQKKTDDIFIQGLKLKGYEFKDRDELSEFIKENCEVHQHPEELIYLVKGEEFLLQVLDKIPKFLQTINPEDPLEFKLEMGGFKFL